MRIIALSAAPLLLAGVALSQSFNVDIGGGTGSTPLPSTLFGAAAGQPGVWNAMDPAVGGTPIILTDVGGGVTSCTFARTAGTGSQLNLTNTGTTGDDDALLDDGDFPPTTGGSTWTFGGLAAGTYQVYTYAWAADSTAFQSNVVVNGGAPTCVGGTFAGTYVVGITHALDTVTVSAGGSINIVFTPPPCVTFHTFPGVQIKNLTPDTPTTAFCLGDGTGVPCPCTPTPNNGSAGRGCGSSAFPGGALLTSTGTASDETSGTDSLVLTATDIPGPALFIQANGTVAAVPFGDGQLCAAVGIIRLGVVFPTGTTASYPGGTTPNEIHLQGLASNGQTKHYQAWYRSVPGVCTAGQNYDLTQGLTLTWVP